MRGKSLVAFLGKIIPDAKEDDLRKLTGRQLEIWAPLLAVARFLDLKHNSDTISEALLRFAMKNISQKIGENLTETADMVLLETLTSMVLMPNWVDDYLAIKDIHGNMLARYDEEQRWLTNEWVGRALKRLGFTDKRRLGSARQVRVSKNFVLELARSHNIEVETPKQVQTPLDGSSHEASQPPQQSQPSQGVGVVPGSDGNDGNDGSDTSYRKPETTELLTESPKMVNAEVEAPHAAVSPDFIDCSPREESSSLQGARFTPIFTISPISYAQDLGEDSLPLPQHIEAGLPILGVWYTKNPRGGS
jgi:hypothetical protein